MPGSVGRRTGALGHALAVLLALLVVTACWHSQLGLQVVVEDYVRGWLRMATLVASAFLHVLLGALGLFAIVRLALGAP